MFGRGFSIVNDCANVEILGLGLEEFVFHLA